MIELDNQYGPMLFWQPREEANALIPFGLWVFSVAEEEFFHIWPSPLELVREFHRTYRAPILPRPEFPEQARLDLRDSLNREEATVELPEAVAARDMVAVADAIGDSIYVMYGMALELGIPIDIVLAGAIQPSNMSKLDESGQPIFREDGKVLKGSSFFPPEPDIREILLAHGWTPPN